MKAHDIIDRLARLDEQTTVEEPEVDPGIAPPATEPGEPGRRPSSDPFELPPDFEPGQMPRPKAEQNDSADISAWLEATEQPIQDWDWDGHELRMLMDDGTTEVYNRNQLEQIGIFNGEMAFAAESQESPEGSSESDNAYGDDDQHPEVETHAKALDAPEFEEHPPDEAAGVLDQILGRTPCGSQSVGEISAEPEVIHIEGEDAEKLNQAVSGVVQAILGIVQIRAEEETPEKASKDDKKADKSKNKKATKPKKDKEKSDDKKDDESDDEKDDDDE